MDSYTENSGEPGWTVRLGTVETQGGKLGRDQQGAGVDSRAEKSGDDSWARNSGESGSTVGLGTAGSCGGQLGREQRGVRVDS